MSKNLLFITTRIFYPTNSGRKLSLYHYCRGLHEKYGYDIYIYTFLEGDQDFVAAVKSKPSFIKKLFCASDIGMADKAKNLVFKSLFSKKWPLQCSLYFNESNLARIKKLCDKIKFDVAMVDMIRLAPYITAIENIPIKILDMDDMLSKRYECEISTNSDPNFIGQYSKKTSKIIKSLLPYVKKFVLNAEIKRLKFSEKYYSQLYNKIIFVSDIEATEMNKILKEDKCIAVTTGVDYKYFSEDIETCKKKNSISFIGNFEYPPNVDSLRLIVNSILPHIKKEIRFFAVGKVNQEVIDEFKDKVVFLGMVDDIRKIIKSTNLFVSPIAYGSGIKTKILEAMAMGVPVITNSVGAEGIKIVNDENAIISDDMIFFATEIDRLLDDPSECKRLSENAKLLIEKEYQWEHIWNEFQMCGI